MRRPRLLNEKIGKDLAPVIRALPGSGRSLLKTLIGISIIVLAGLACLLAGPAALAYLAFYLAALLPGLPIGFTLFGRRHGAGWVFGLLIGYALTALTVGLPVQLGLQWRWAPVLAWLLLLTVAWVLPRPAAPLVPLPPWTRRDTSALLVALLFVPVLAGPALARIGSRGPDGHERYRAYFTADFLWHVALTAELARASSPPRNPYLARRPLHYYWTYFNVPATVVRLGAVAADIRAHLAVNALCSGLLFVAALFVSAWAVVPRAGPVLAGTTVALLAASAEGAFAVWRFVSRGVPLGGLRELNIDAITSWWFQTLTIDSLPRSLWYTPQHAMACSLSLVAVTVAARGGSAVPLAATLAAGLSLGLALIFSPFLGGAFALIYGLAAVWNGARGGRRAVPIVSRYALAAVPVTLALGWCVGSGTFEGAGGAVAIGLSARAMAAPLTLLFLALGPTLMPAVAGLGTAVRRFPLHAVWCGMTAALFMLFFVTLTKEPIWIGWRAGQIFLVLAPAPVAALFAVLSDARRRLLAATVLVVVLAAGLPTTAIDWWNAQDVSNTSMGPGFRWTIGVSPDTRAAVDWIRTNTAPEAVVQMSIGPRGRETWTLIPTFAERRMAAGEPISLLAAPEYDERSAEADAMFRTADPTEAWRLARALRLDYVYVDQVEREAFGQQALAKFDDAHFFRRVFASGAAAVYAVQ